MLNDAAAIFFKVAPRDVNFVNRVFEGYEYVGVVSTVDKARGILVVRATPDTVDTAREILANLPVEIYFL